MIQKRITQSGEPRYLVRLFRGRDTATGKKLYAFQTFATRKDAVRWRTQQRQALEAGTFVQPAHTPLGEYLRGWLDGPATQALTERTLHDYRRLMIRYVLGTDLAGAPLSRLSTTALEQFYGSLAARPLSARTVRLVHSILHAALGRAVRSRLLAFNPATGVALPRQERRRTHALDGAQVYQLLGVSAETGNRFHALWHLLVNSGMRPSEALALKWTDLGTDRVVVRRVLVAGLKGGGRRLMEPRRHGTRRTITLPASTMDALADHRARQEIERAAAGANYGDEGFVFAGRTGSPVDLKNLTARHFNPLLAKAGLPKIRVYDLRHTHATLMLAAGVPLKAVAERLGHVSAAVTLNIYPHVLNGQHEDPVSRLEAYMAAG
jgi:integrase